MSQTVINMLKIIQIHIEHGSFAVLLFRSIYISGKIPLAAHSVVKTGQEIRIGLLFYFFLINFLIRSPIKN